VLRDYVDTGFEERDGATRLAFQRDIETRIYNTLPHHLPTVLRRHPLKCPVAFIAGTQSAEMRQGGIEASRLLAKDRFVWMEGTHLFPMEKPDATAAEVLRLVGSMEQPAH
jgi:pimeloyl-ACP methyl ester carboxylesterase